MNDYTAKQLRSLDERIAAKKAEREKILKYMQEESDSSITAMVIYMIPAVMVSLVILIMLFLLFAGKANAETLQVEKMVDAIYKAEGGDKAQYPYGIRSVKCETKDECRRICINTIKNNAKRWNKYGYKTHRDFLSFLASRYAPIGVENDPNNLNINWIKNVKFYLGGV